MTEVAAVGSGIDVVPEETHILGFDPSTRSCKAVSFPNKLDGMCP